MTDVTDKPLTDMSLSELTQEYNRQCEQIEANHTGLKPLKPFKRIKLFKDRTTALKRIGDLHLGASAQEIEVNEEAEAHEAAVADHEPESTIADDPVSENEEEETVVPAPKKKAKKAAAKKPAPKKAAKKAAAPKREPKPKAEGLSGEFGFRSGGERDQLLVILASHMNHQVLRKDMGEVAKFIGKVKLRINRKKLPFTLKKEKSDDGVSYGLYRK